VVEDIGRGGKDDVQRRGLSPMPCSSILEVIPGDRGDDYIL
jgi:hypothetical protein